MKLIVTTCGTSLFTNPARGNVELLDLLNECANLRDDADLRPGTRDRIASHLESCGTRLRVADAPAAHKACAELSGLLGLGATDLPAATRDQHILLHTDTWLGRRAAELLRDYLQAAGVTAVATECIDRLNTASLDDFHDGLRHLVRWAADTLPGYRDSRYRIVFNLVGGFKSLQGFMQTLGMFYADEIVYIFETGGQLLRVPRIPVNLGAAAVEQVRRHLPLFRRLSALAEPRPAAELPDGLSDLFVYQLDGEFELSAWGRLVWEQCRPEIYRERLLDPWSSRVRFTAAFRADARHLPPDRTRQLNERIDDLARCVESGTNLARLDLKPLRGNPKPPATHEADAWADADCRRLFLHYDEQGVAVLDRFDHPLH